ncbi:signal peptidase I [Paenibacillus arenilitoris]|uniref:Signal peptidase I n=1 Tax=Paenibacillus arenilitoris TaxID=2772299 RepID=A0A927CSR9_9BACL|nr:signal peptidase I [Paenibacillus arenilitoris]MBD2871211.1 signal peptidase I [Paenibacillus arenilitoris]
MKTEERPKKSWTRELREWTVSLAVAVVAALLFQTYIYAQSEVHNVSMQNTLVEGQRLIEDKWSYRLHEPERGDIVVIDGPESDLRLIKRVIALPGDVLDIRHGDVYLNGEKLEEPYAKGRTFAGSVAMPYEVEPGQLFVMGDNRENSMDSRTLGPIARDSIEGKAVFRIWPIGRFGTLGE